MMPISDTPTPEIHEQAAVQEINDENMDDRIPPASAETPAGDNQPPSPTGATPPVLNSEEKADSAMPSAPLFSTILMAATVKAVNDLGDRYIHFGVCTENPFSEVLTMAAQKRDALTAFASSNAECNLTFQIPETPPGGDDLEQMFKEACVILDGNDRAHAIDAAVTRGAKFLADVLQVSQLISTHIRQLSAGLSAADDIRDIVTSTLQEFDSITTELNNEMRGKAIHTDVQLAHFEKVVEARALVRSDLLRDEDPIRDARELLSTLYNSALTPQKRIDSLYYLMEEVEDRRCNKAVTYKDRVHKSNWVPPMYSVYAEKWTMATVSSMNNARLPITRRRQPVFSPFAVLPRHVRATAPHQGTTWWEVGPTNPRYDFLQLRQDTLNEATNLCDG
jgi:hypothetical protein